jgi:hypothetical protein
MVKGPHLHTPKQGDPRLDPEGSSRLSVLDPPRLHKDVQRPEGTVLVGKDEGRHYRVRHLMRHVSESEGGTPETRRFSSAARNTHVEVGGYQHGLPSGFVAHIERV